MSVIELSWTAKKIRETVTPQNDGYPKLVSVIVFYLSPLGINSQKEMLVVGILRVNHH